MTQSTTMPVGRQLCFAIYSASHAFTRAYRPLLEPLGLTYPQYLVLLVLWDQDSLRVKEIGSQLFLDSGTLTPLLKRLEAQGFVRRVRDTEDERQVTIMLTAAGRDLKAKVVGFPDDLSCLHQMDEEEFRDLLIRVCDLRRKLQGTPTPSLEPAA